MYWPARYFSVSLAGNCSLTIATSGAGRSMLVTRLGILRGGNSLAPTTVRASIRRPLPALGAAMFQLIGWLMQLFAVWAVMEAFKTDPDCRVFLSTDAGGVGLFYFSGHGAQAPDMSGDEGGGYDEILLPADASGWKGATRSVEKRPGATLLTRMLSGASSTASVLAKSMLS